MDGRKAGVAGLSAGGGILAMEAITLKGCFGWFHTPASGRRFDVAVLLCPGLHRDALDSHQCFRLLADAFAVAGYPALRFDYPSTGDSCEIEDAYGGAGEPWVAWQQSVHASADWLRNATGARKLVLCGLRIGATLATLAAAGRDDVAGLILLAPILRGYSYMLQLGAEARLRPGADARPGNGLNFEALRFTAETVDLINRADLRQVGLRTGQQVAIFSRSSSGTVVSCADAWTRSGAVVTRFGFEGLEPMLRHNLQSRPPTDFSAVIDWLCRAVPARTAPAPTYPSALTKAMLQPAGCTEIPLRFGANEKLFGMLCRPDGGPGEMAVIIGNTGRDPHYGYARFGVTFARRLAASGIASLRIDFAGLGDSVGPPGQELVLSHVLELDRSPDIRAAIDVLTRLGYRRFAVNGLCAGAYHAFHAALADPRIGTLLLVNMPVFTWRAGESIGFVHQKTSTPGRYLSELGRRETWRRLRRGETDISGIFRAQCIRQYERARTTALRLAIRLGRPAPQTAAHLAMAELSARRARTLFVFAPGDDGLAWLEEEFGPQGEELDAFEGVRVQVAPEINHSLSESRMQRFAADLMISFLDAAPDVSDHARAAGKHPIAAVP